MFTGSIPNPTPPSRSSRSSARGKAEGCGGLEAGAVERADLVLAVRPHEHPLERPRERRPDRLAAPARVARGGGPAVVVVGAADGDDAAVVRRAAADHPRARERERLAAGEVAARVAPVVRGDEGAAVEQVGRPGARAARARSPGLPRRARRARRSRPRGAPRRRSRHCRRRRRRRRIRSASPCREYRTRPARRARSPDELADRVSAMPRRPMQPPPRAPASSASTSAPPTTARRSTRSSTRRSSVTSASSATGSRS